MAVKARLPILAVPSEPPWPLMSGGRLRSHSLMKHTTRVRSDTPVGDVHSLPAARAITEQRRPQIASNARHLIFTSAGTPR
jgi:hypothetical protein